MQIKMLLTAVSERISFISTGTNDAAGNSTRQQAKSGIL
jgi:hypothetical protein